MPLRPPAGFIRPGFDPLKNPNAPTAVAATGGDASASVSFTPPANVGGSAISAYYAVSNPGQVTVSGATSPINVTGLTNGTPYTFSVWALNTYGPGPFSAMSGSVTPSLPVYGLFAGGSGFTQTVSVINIPTTGNATSFGTLISPVRFQMAGCGSSTRAVFGGGQDSQDWSSAVTYSTFSTTGTFLSFGSLTVARGELASCNSSTRGVFLGGNSTNVIDYITIATTGNATDFGDLSVGTRRNAACSSPTRGLVVMGDGDNNTIQYITIATTGNAINFGDLTGYTSIAMASCSSSTRGLIGGGYVGSSGQNIISYVTISSTGNTVDFGDLVSPVAYLAACSSTTRGVFGGGGNAQGQGSAATNVIQYVTIASVGNAIDFGDLLSSGYDGVASCSSSNGGVQ